LISSFVIKSVSDLYASSVPVPSKEFDCVYTFMLGLSNIV